MYTLLLSTTLSIRAVDRTHSFALCTPSVWFMRLCSSHEMNCFRISIPCVGRANQSRRHHHINLRLLFIKENEQGKHVITMINQFNSDDVLVYYTYNNTRKYQTILNDTTSKYALLPNISSYKHQQWQYHI